MTTKQTKKIFSITQKLDETYWFTRTDEEIATFEIPRTCSVNQKGKLGEERNSNRRNACNRSR